MCCRSGFIHRQHRCSFFAVKIFGVGNLVKDEAADPETVNTPPASTTRADAQSESARARQTRRTDRVQR